MKYYESLERKVVELINKIFGFQNLRNLDKTKMGSTILVEILNENINNFKDIIEEILSEVYRALLKRTKIEKKKFVGIKISPKLYIPETIITTIMKLYPRYPKIINEILEKTSIMPIKALEELSGEITVGDGQKKPSEEEKEDDKKEEDHFDEKIKEVSKKRKREEEENTSNKKMKLSFDKKYFENLKYQYNNIKFCKFKKGDSLRIKNDLRNQLNGKKFIISDTVMNSFNTTNLYFDKKLWTNPIVMDYLFNYSDPNFEVLYYGRLDGSNDYKIISEINLVELVNNKM